MRILRRTIGAALFVSIAVWFGSATDAADSTAPADLTVLKVIPENALAVVIVNHLDKVDEQIGKLTQEMQIPAPQLLPLLKLRVGIQEGLDEHGSAALAFLPGAEGSGPVAVGIVPVTDYKKFIAQLQPEDASAEITKVTVTGESSLVGKKDSFAILVDSSHKDLLKKILDGSRPITPVIGGLTGWIGEHDLSFVATPTGVKQGTAAARKGLAQIKATLANANNESTKMAAGNLDPYDWLLASAEKELSAVGVGLHVDNDGGLHVDTRALFVANGEWAAAGKGLERPSGTKLACLPSGSYLLAFDGAMPKSVSKSFMNMSVNMINNMAKASGGKELTAEQAKQLDSFMDAAMADVRSMSMVMGEPKPGSSLYANMSAAIKVKDSHRYLTAYQKLIENMSELMKQSGVELPILQEFKKIKIDDLDGVQMTMDMSKFLAKIATNNPAAKQMMQMMFGPEGKLNIYLAPIDDTTIALSYVNSDGIARVKAACKNPQASLAADADIAQTAKLLPEGAQWVGYLSLKGLMDFVNSIMLAAAPPGGGGRIPALPAFPQTPPVGFGAEVSGKGLDLQIVVPGAALKGIGTYVKTMQMMFAPGAPPKFR